MQERRTAPALTGVDRHRPARRFVLTVLVAVVVVVVDQVATTWAVHRLTHGPIHIVGPVQLRLEVNTGSAFGLAQGWAPVIGAIAVVAIVVMVVASWRVRSTAMAVALGLVIGGAAGNLVDRVARHYHGGVVDFIDLKYWPTFNVADACITVGVIVLAWSLWRTGSRSTTVAEGNGAGDAVDQR